MSLLGSSVVHKEKHVRKQEHKLKIMPMNADVIVLGLQSKDQAEQWLRVRRMHEAASCFLQCSSEFWGAGPQLLPKGRMLWSRVDRVYDPSGAQGF